MDMVIWVGIIVLAAVIHATLQLGLGSLLLLYHASLGKHIKKQTKNLTGSFISGVGLITFFGLCAACYVIANGTGGGSMDPTGLMVMTVILMVLALAMWIFYYRRGDSTELWVPGVVAEFIDGRAKKTNNNTEAFSLGVLSALLELPMSLALFVLAADSVLEIPVLWQLLMILLYTLISIAPLVILKLSIRSGKTVTDIQKWRVKNKNFLRIMSGVGYLVLAGFVFAFKVLGV